MKWFSKNKGYGFISGEDGQEYFVHWRSLSGEGYKILQEDDEVEFDTEQTEKGVQAINVTKLTK